MLYYYITVVGLQIIIIKKMKNIFFLKQHSTLQELYILLTQKFETTNVNVVCPQKGKKRPAVLIIFNRKQGKIFLF